jgi:Ulp1 family protease
VPAQNQDALVARLRALRHNAHFIEAFGISLSGKHARQLRNGEWICDDVVDFFFELLVTATTRAVGSRRRGGCRAATPSRIQHAFLHRIVAD